MNGHGQAIGSPWQKLHLGEEEFGNFMLQQLTGLPPAFSSRQLKDAGSEARADDLSGSMSAGGTKTLLQQLKESQFKTASGLADQFGKIYPDWRRTMFNVVGHDAQADVSESTTDSRDQFTGIDRGLLIMMLEITQNSRENIVRKTFRDMSPPGCVPKSLTKPVPSQQDQSAGAEMDER